MKPKLEVGRLLKEGVGESKIRPPNPRVALKLQQQSPLIRNLILPTVTTTATPPTKKGRTVRKQPPRVVQR